MKILEAENLSKQFGGVQAVKGISFHINEREVLGLIGPNGAGKTTLFNIVAGTFKPDEGGIRFNGIDITRKKPQEICKLGISRTYQSVKPFLNQTVLQNALVGILFGRSSKTDMETALKEANAILSLVGLGGQQDTYVDELSFLDRKRVELARALSTQPKLLLLDEPFAGLNSAETEEFLDVVRRLRESNVTVFIIEHVMRAVMTISHRIIVLHHGQKIAEGHPEDMIQDRRVIDVYLGRT